MRSIRPPVAAGVSGLLPVLMRFSCQIQFWKIISRLNVSIEVPMNAAEIGSMTTKPAKPTRTKAHNSQRGVLPRRSA